MPGALASKTIFVHAPPATSINAVRDRNRFVMEPLEASQLGPAPRQHAGSGATSDVRLVDIAKEPPKVGTAGAAAEPPQAQHAAAVSTVRAVPLPALRLEHFQTADLSAPPASADAASSAAVSLSNFDHAAYAEFQALFDVPAGRSAPYLLPPDKSKGRSLASAAEGSAAIASAAGEQPTGVTDVRKCTEFLQGDVMRWVRDYLRSDAGRAELARALHHPNGGRSGH